MAYRKIQSMSVVQSVREPCRKDIFKETLAPRQGIIYGRMGLDGIIYHRRFHSVRPAPSFHVCMFPVLYRREKTVALVFPYVLHGLVESLDLYRNVMRQCDIRSEGDLS